ncbi:MAG: peptidoglycan DD-metalloendopeptidase family protein [Enhydrobacter sp.]|nr:MAG: peptidoglycan DD-metalloendopeptidase family protein [Enhydrobacter sp.]
MTDSPPPSGRSESRRSNASALIGPILFAIGVAGLAADVLVLAHEPAPPIEVSATPPANVVLADPEPPPPITPADVASSFKGFQLSPPADDQEQPTEAKPPTDRYDLTLRLERGDTVEKLLADIEVVEADRKNIAAKLNELLKKRRLPVGQEINLLIQNVAEQPDVLRVLSMSVRPQPEREYIVTRRNDGGYDGEAKVYKVSPRIVRVETTRQGSLQQSGVRAGAPSAAMVEFIRALAYDVDFQRELKEGQKFSVLLEQLVTSDGRVTHPGRLLAGELHLLKRTVTVIRFRPQGGAEGFFNPQGESVVRSFLRTPMDVSKVTSRFGVREHPILGFSAMHAGVDFAAPTGTPILAAGAGKVVAAGPNGGYGLYVKLQHTNDVATAYAHMSRLGPGIKPGISVRQGQVIGFVGSTGMSTGPHLHYEFHRGGKQVNPLTQKFAMRATVGGKDLATFQKLSRQYLAQLKNAPAVADSAPAKPKQAPPSQVARSD